MVGVEESERLGDSYRNGARRSSRSRSPGDRGRREDSHFDNNPGNNLHVSGLTSKVDDQALETTFSSVGRVVKAQVVLDPHSRASRGFGFVTMETAELAEAAVHALNNTELLGKIITVGKARRGRARTPTPGKYFGPPKRRPGRDNDHRPYDPRPYDSRYTRDSRDRDHDRRERGDRRDRYERDSRDPGRDRDHDRRDRGGERYGDRDRGYRGRD
ncbi:hypothetical protein GYMLUDRAFT_520951 [Collybiopsis luxurians FD-317 M1]|nr:hypothetical protein GYMLUDRAFT_520951 [Collybiopsis luxurians FD-317 M1]